MKKQTKPKRIRKSETVGIRLTEEEIGRIEARARSRQMNASEHIRDLIRRDLEQSERPGAAA